MTYEQIEEKIRMWAEDQKTVRALTVIGSRARTDRAADTWSDLDLILFVTDLNVFASDGAWLDGFGQVVLRYLQVTGKGYPEWIALYDRSVKVDFLIALHDRPLAEALSGSPFDVVSRRGVRVLIDKGDSGTVQAPGKAVTRPQQQAVEFESAVHQFWITAYRAATMIRRGDLWRARHIMDVNLRRLITQMMAWHAQASGTGIDTWYDGRFIDEWADPRALATLAGLFAAYEQTATVKALREMLDLYEWIARETAVRKQHPYPTAALDQVRDWIEAILQVSLENLESSRAGQPDQ